MHRNSFYTSLPPERHTEADAACLDIMPPSRWDVQHLPGGKHHIRKAEPSKTWIQPLRHCGIQVDLAAVCGQPTPVRVKLPAAAGGVQADILFAHHLYMHPHPHFDCVVDCVIEAADLGCVACIVWHVASC